MKTTKSKASASSVKIPARTMMPLMSQTDFQVSKDSIRFPKKAKGKFDSDKMLIEKIGKYSGLHATIITDYLLLSAKTPYVADKGYFNAINCQSVFPEDPHIDFPWWSQAYKSLPTPGKLEIWLTNLVDHQNLTIELRVSGYSYNNSDVYEVRSSLSPGLYGYFPIKYNQKIDLFFPDIEVDTSNMALITIEPVDINGSWIFYDAKVNMVE